MSDHHAETATSPASDSPGKYNDNLVDAWSAVAVVAIVVATAVYWVSHQV